MKLHPLRRADAVRKLLRIDWPSESGIGVVQSQLIIRVKQKPEGAQRCCHCSGQRGLGSKLIARGQSAWAVCNKLDIVGDEELQRARLITNAGQ